MLLLKHNEAVINTWKTIKTRISNDINSLSAALILIFYATFIIVKGTEECPVKSVVNRVAIQLAKALQTKGMALLVNHGISDEKVFIIAQISLAAQFNFKSNVFFLVSAQNLLFALRRFL